MNQRSTGSWYPSGPVIVWAAVVFVLVGAVMLLFLPALLLDEWVPGLAANARGKFIASAAQVVLLALGGAIAVVGVALSIARHGEALRAAERDQQRAELQRASHELEREKEKTRAIESARVAEATAERDLRGRFLSAVELMFDEQNVTKRTAGAHALGSLADDWHALGRMDEVQVCIDVLCGFLRLWVPGENAECAPGERVARTAVFSIIRAHLGAGAKASWGASIIDLSHVHFDEPVDLTDMRLAGGVLSLRDAVIGGSGELRLHRLHLTGGATVHAENVRLEPNALLSLEGASFSEASRFNMRRVLASEGGVVQVADLRLSEGASLNLGRGRFEKKSALVARGCVVSGGSELAGRQMNVADASVFGFNGSVVSGGARIDLRLTTISGETHLAFDRTIATGPGSCIDLSGVQTADKAFVTFVGARVQAEATLDVRDASFSSAFSDGSIETDERSTVLT